MMTNLSLLAGRLQRLGLDQRFAMDIGSVVLGVRKRALLHVPELISQGVRELAAEYGLKEVASKRLIRRADPGSREGLLYDAEADACRSDEQWTEIWFEAGNLSSTPLVRPQGEWDLGYPDCCVAAYAGSRTIAAHYRRFLRCEERGFWEINRLSAVFCNGFFMPDFFPCSLACSAAVEFSRMFLAVAEQTIDIQTIDKWRSVMQGVFALHGERLYCWPRWECVRGVLQVDNQTASSVALAEIASEISRAGTSEVVVLPMSHFLPELALGSSFELRVRSLDGSETALPSRLGVAPQ